MRGRSKRLLGRRNRLCQAPCVILQVHARTERPGEQNLKLAWTGSQQLTEATEGALSGEAALLAERVETVRTIIERTLHIVRHLAKQRGACRGDRTVR